MYHEENKFYVELSKTCGGCYSFPNDHMGRPFKMAYMNCDSGHPVVCTCPLRVARKAIPTEVVSTLSGLCRVDNIINK